MSTQHGNIPELGRNKGGGRNRRPRPFKLWYRVTYAANPSYRLFNYTIKMGPYRSEDERQRVMDHVLRQHDGYNRNRRPGHENLVEFFFEKPE